MTMSHLVCHDYVRHSLSRITWMSHSSVCCCSVCGRVLLQWLYSWLYQTQVSWIKQLCISDILLCDTTGGGDRTWNTHLFNPWHTVYLKQSRDYIRHSVSWIKEMCISSPISCSVLQCVAVCCSVSWIKEMCISSPISCSVLQCVAVCCSVLQCVAVCHGLKKCVFQTYFVRHRRRSD